MRIAICDDDDRFCTKLEDLILDSEYGDVFSEKIDVFNSGESLIKAIENYNHYDILFLDVNMEGMNGFEVRDYIRDEIYNRRLEIIYISADKSNIWKATTTKLSGFITKPIKEEDVLKCLSDAIQQVSSDKAVFSYKIGRSINYLQLDDIIYFQAYKKHLNIVCVDQTYEYYGSIKELASRNIFPFVKIHAAYYINFSHIRQQDYDEVVMSNGKKLTISQSQRQIVKERMQQLAKMKF